MAKSIRSGSKVNGNGRPRQFPGGDENTLTIGRKKRKYTRIDQQNCQILFFNEAGISKFIQKIAAPLSKEKIVTYIYSLINTSTAFENLLQNHIVQFNQAYFF